MAAFTKNYGALSSIQDNTNSYSMTDSKGNSYTFEVYPLNISPLEITNALNTIGNPNVWFVSYKTTITPPNEQQINKALSEGLLIVLSIKCTIFDNYGLQHSVLYNKDIGKYEISISRVAPLIGKKINVIPFSDKLISLVQDSSDPDSLVLGLDNSTRDIVNKLYGRIDEQQQIIEAIQNNSGGGSTSELESQVKDLEMRVQQLEMKLGRF